MRLETLILSLPIGEVSTIGEVHDDLGAVAGEHRQGSHSYEGGSYDSFLDEVIGLGRFEIHLKSVRIVRL